MARTKVQTDMINFGGTEIDRRKNYIVNPGMRISQENGTSSGTANGYYPVDQFYALHSQDGTLTYQQVASATPGGSTHRIRMTVTSADASIAAGQYAGIETILEGSRVSDLLFGSASVKQIVFRFGFKGPAGTYAVALRNAAGVRSYIREFTIAGGEANTDTVQTVTFPGDTSGTWPTGDVAGMSIAITVAAGSTFQTTADAWQAGDYIGTASTSNGIGTGSAVFELFDVGMYADPDETGVAPPFVLPDYDDDLRDCQRYYEIIPLPHIYTGVNSGTSFYVSGQYKVAKRTTPSASVYAQCQYYSSGTPTNYTPTLTPQARSVLAQAIGTLTNCDGIVGGDIAINARL